MAFTQQDAVLGKPEQRSGLQHFGMELAHWLVRIAMLPHYLAFRKTTYRPIKRITESTTPDEARVLMLEWCKRKMNEAKYVQVAGAVMFASVVSCLGWDSIAESFWLASACFYASILLSLSSIFAAAQQTIALSDDDAVSDYDARQIEALQMSLLNKAGDAPSLITLFAWQSPIMFMGYSVGLFVIGLTTVVITPLATQPEWGASANTVILFLVIMLFIGVSAAISTPIVHSFRV